MDLDVIDRLGIAMKRLKKLEVEVRFEDLNGTPSGLCILGGQRVLMVEVSLRSIEQLELFEKTIELAESNSNQAAA